MSPILAVWIGVTTATMVLTLLALREAIRDRQAVHVLNGKAREIAVDGDVRREALRLLKQAILLSIAVPPLLDGRDVHLTWGVGSLVAVAVLLFVQSALDLRERRELVRVIGQEMRS